MTIQEAVVLLDAEILQHDFTDNAFTTAYTADLLSDVLAHSCGGALITVQAHKTTVAVALQTKCTVIILCNNRPIADNDMLDAAKKCGIAIIRSKENQFIVSGKLYNALHSYYS